MKILKKIIIGLIIFAALIVIGSFILPSEMKMDRTATINASPEKTFKLVNTMKEWEKWSPWHTIDPNMKITYEGPESGQGAAYRWNSENPNAGVGRLELIEVIDNQFIKARMDFEGMGSSNSTFNFEKVPDGVKVTWGFYSNGEGMPFLFKILSPYFNLFMGDMLAKDFDRGLHRLDSVVKTIPDEVNYTYNIDEVPFGPVIGLTKDIKCSMAEFSVAFKKVMEELSAHMEAEGIQIAGSRFAIYNKWGDEIEFTAGFQVASKGKDKGDFKFMEYPVMNTVHAGFYGAYEATIHGHNAIESYLKENKKEVIGGPWEVYVTDPSSVTDPSQILTEIYYPVK